MIIGKFEYDAKTDTFFGDVMTLQFSFTDMRIEPIKKTADKQPEYRVVAGVQHGVIELGAGWKRKAKKGHEKEFVSIQLDAPLLDAPLYARLFFEENGKASMVWNRAKAEVATTKKAA